MKYFCISDVHGCYDKMIAALNEAGFDKEKDTLVSIGDLFDRGLKSKEVLEYVMSCPHHLLCMGNHDLRLMQLIKNPYDYNQYDASNGVFNTLKSFLGDQIQEKGTWDALASLDNYKLLTQYFCECKGAFEFSNLIITHGWIPVIDARGPQPKLNENWRSASVYGWEDALWANTEIMIEKKLYPGKTLLIGHWHAWRLAEKFGEKRQTNKHLKENYINCAPFTYTYKGKTKWIAIDGCTNYEYGGRVNVYQFETDEKPQIILKNFNFPSYYYF